MGWMRVKDGFIRCDSIIYIRRSTYLYDNKYRLIIDLSNGDTAIYHEYDTREETEEAMHHLIKWLNDKNKRGAMA